MSSSKNEGKPNRLVELDALRGISILLVLIEHSDSFTLWSSSFNIHDVTGYQFNTGLVLFFAISGFAMSMAVFSRTYDEISLREKLSEYFRRRLWRIQPLALIWIGLTMIAAYLGNFVFGWRGYFGNWHVTYHEAIYAILPIANFRSQEAFGGLHIFSVFWTLAIEEQFYLLFPFLIFTAKSRRRALVNCVIALVICIALFRNPYLSAALQDYPKLQAALNAPWYQPIFFGVLAYFGAKRFRSIVPQRFDWLVRFIGLAMILVMPRLDQMSPLWNGFGTPAICAFAIFCASLSDRGFQWPWTATLAWIGRRSYGIYLAHLPISMLNRELWNASRQGVIGDGNWRLEISGLLTWAILTMIAVEVLYQYVEEPLANFGRRKVQMTIAKPSTETYAAKINAVP